MTDPQGACSSVLYVEPKNAKRIKTLLEKQGLLHKDFRMTVAVDNSWKTLDSSCSSASVALEGGKLIAVPVVSLNSALSVGKENDDYNSMVIATGQQFCPYSSAALGNHKKAPATTPALQRSGATKIHQVLLETLLQTYIKNDDAPIHGKEKLFRQSIAELSVATCPKKLEVLGDDRTLVIPRRAFSLQEKEFLSLVLLCTKCKNQKDPLMDTAMIAIWQGLARSHGSPRVVRRGDIDPNSPIRESGHVLLWPAVGSDALLRHGLESPGWITVTEHGIRQSFDLTRVMFSRGNITEKIRFGKELVQENDIVLDMYAGIGYYTLPALLHGKARHVVACEWNPHAAFALKYNLEQNGVKDKATVHVGDCRQVARQHGLVNRFDHVSLGLLPSSEGGWRTAVKALRHDTGGWLHVHGNVPGIELTKWQEWLCCSLVALVQEDLANPNRETWIVLCTHIERVKSFAPKIHHYVADVWIGPPSDNVTIATDNHKACAIRDGHFIPCPNEVAIPSCALSSIGVLNQSWMMDCDKEFR